MAKRLFRLSMLVDAAVLYDVTAAANKRAYNMEIVPVVGGGDDDGDGEMPASNGHDTSPRVPMITLLMPFFERNDEFDIKDALTFGVNRGGAKGAIYTAVLAAMREGLLKRLNPGRYKVMAGMKKAAAKAAANGGGKTRAPSSSAGREVGHEDFIGGVLAKQPMTRADIKAAFVADDRPERSIDGAMHRMKNKKLIAKSKDGTWQLTAKGATASAS